jgi:hypothetical protein
MHDGYVCLYVENVCFHGLYFRNPSASRLSLRPCTHPSLRNPSFSLLSSRPCTHPLLGNPLISWQSSRPCTHPPFDFMPLLDRRIGDFDPWIRGGGHGLFSPLGHGVGGRSRRSRRVTTLPLHNARHPLSLVTAAPGLGASNSYSAISGTPGVQGGGPYSDVWIFLLPPGGALGACVEERARSPLVVSG